MRVKPINPKWGKAKSKKAIRAATIEVTPTQLAGLEAQLVQSTQTDLLRESIPPVFDPLFGAYRYKGAWGGRGSSKSWSFARMLLHRCKEKPGTRVVCVREVQRTLSQSVKRLLDDTITAFDLGSQFRSLNTHIETPGNGVIIFQGMQDHTNESIKSLEGFDIAWVEEAQALSNRSLTLLRPTMRKADSELWFTWNPRRITDPVDVLLRNKVSPPRTCVVQANYSDNPHFPSVLQEEMEWDRARDIEKYNHIWLGQYERHSEARVFRNWRVEDFEVPDQVEWLMGGDWGFSVDPSVLVAAFIIGKTLYIRHEVYKVGCPIDHTPALFDSLGCTQNHLHAVLADPLDPTSCACDRMARGWLITTDSARPETIDYMQRHGYPRVVGAKKGPGSVHEGIEFLKNYDIVVHSDCKHTADEFTMYSYKKHPLTDEIMPILDDKKNHVIDSCRYTVESLRTNTFDWQEAGMTSEATW